MGAISNSSTRAGWATSVVADVSNGSEEVGSAPVLRIHPLFTIFGCRLHLDLVPEQAPHRRLHAMAGNPGAALAYLQPSVLANLEVNLKCQLSLCLVVVVGESVGRGVEGTVY